MTLIKKFNREDIVRNNWDHIKEKIRMDYNISSISYATWIENLEFVCLRGDMALIRIPSDRSVVLEYAEHNFSDCFKTALTEVLGNFCDVSFTLSEKDGQQSSKAPSESRTAAVFEMNLRPEPFEKIVSGRKTVELRLFDSKRRQLNIGDCIVFSCEEHPERQTAVEIRALYRYGSFAELFSEIHPSECGFAKEVSPAQAVEHMREYYSEKRERKCGVIGIRIKPVPLEPFLSLQEEIRNASFEDLMSPPLSSLIDSLVIR